MARAGRPINLTRALLRYALHESGPDWIDAVPLLAAVTKAIIRRHGRDVFYATVTRDLEVAPAPTLRAVVMRALDSTPDTVAALRLVREVMDGNESPGLAALVRKETHREVVGSVFRALREEDRAQVVSRQMAFRWPAPGPTDV